MNHIKIKEIAVAGLFSALICVGAYIKIPIPNLPITMQVFFVLLTGLLLKPRAAFLSFFVYIVLGLVGLPVFTGGGGPGYVFIPSFGFVLGFMTAAYVMSVVMSKIPKGGISVMALVSVLGIVIIYTVGIPYFALIANVYNGGDNSALWFIETLLLPFIPKEIISAVAAVLTAYKLKPLMSKI